jgi:hypothetical protein
MTNNTLDTDRLSQIFFQDDLKHLRKIESNKTRFVHYTTAESAISILNNKEVWMRNAMCMNDYSEVHHGLNCLYQSYETTLKPALEKIPSNLSKEVEDTFNAWTPHFISETYLTCISEHDDLEDKIGRLSMWRAYSGTTGIALVLNYIPLLSTTDILKIYTTRVEYSDKNLFQNKLKKIAQNIESEIDFIKTQNINFIKNYVFQALRFAILSTKHPGFKEEREWRVIYSPTLEESKHLIKDIKVIKGIPQTIYKIPLKNQPEQGLSGMEIPELIDSIIIGPTQYSKVTKQVFIQLLQEAGVQDSDKKVHVSDIPLRQ